MNWGCVKGEGVIHPSHLSQIPNNDSLQWWKDAIAFGERKKYVRNNNGKKEMLTELRIQYVKKINVPWNNGQELNYYTNGIGRIAYGGGWEQTQNALLLNFIPKDYNLIK